MYKEIAERQHGRLRENIMMALPHELRTPLNVILGFSDLLMTDCQLMDAERIGEMSRHINLVGAAAVPPDRKLPDLHATPKSC